MGSYLQSGYNLGIGYIDPSDSKARDLSKMRDEFYQSNYTTNSTHWQQGMIDKRFKVGDPTLCNQMYGPNTQYAQRFFINLTRRHSNMICGYQRKNRKSTIVLPVHENDDSLSDDFTAAVRYCEDRDGFQEYFSECFEGAVDVGSSLLWMYPDYANDPISGDLFTDCVAWNSYVIDQHWRKQDLSDCNGILRRKWVSKEGLKLLIPGMFDEIKKLRPGGMADGKFPLQAELMNLQISNLFAYDEFLYRTTRQATMVIDPYTSEGVEWEQEDEDSDELMKMTLRQQPWLQVKKTQIPTVNLGISIGDKTIYDGPNLLGIDCFPCVPMVCYHEPDIQSYAWRCTGVIRSMRDPQFLYNMRKLIELQLLQSQVNAGWIYPVDAVVDSKAFRQASGGDAYLIPLKTGKTPDLIRRIDPVSIPESLMQLSQSLSEDITKVSGVNEELLGSATDDKAGILSMLRQGAGLVTLQGIFDRADYTQRLYGKIRLKAMRKNFKKGKIKNILGREPDPRFFYTNVDKYSLVVEEGNYHATQRQQELLQLLHMKEIGMTVSDKTIWRVANVTNKRQALQEAQEDKMAASQAQQAEMELKSKVDNAKVMNSYSKSRVDLAKERELIASTQEKYAKIDEIESSAEHKRTEADYNLVKIMLELENADQEIFKKSWEMAKKIKDNKSQEQFALMG